MQSGEQETGVAVTHVELAVRRIRQVGERSLGDAVRPIPAAREPDRIDCRVGHHFAERREPRRIGAGKWPAERKHCG